MSFMYNRYSVIEPTDSVHFLGLEQIISSQALKLDKGWRTALTVKWNNRIMEIQTLNFESNPKYPVLNTLCQKSQG